jgi:hypothetical protein
MTSGPSWPPLTDRPPRAHDHRRMPLPTSYAQLRRLIDAKAVFAGLPNFTSPRYRTSFTPGEWLEGMILTESSGLARARRYEPHQDRATRTDAPADPEECDRDDGDLEDDASYGLMQVMGYNIRALVGVGTVKTIHTPRGPRVVNASIAENGQWPPMSFAWAFLPDTNITLGIRVILPELKAVGGDVERALARYNGGPTGDDVAPEYGNDMRLRSYVDKVVANAAKVAQDRRQSGWPVVTA